MVARLGEPSSDRIAERDTRDNLSIIFWCFYLQAFTLPEAWWVNKDKDALLLDF